MPLGILGDNSWLKPTPVGAPSFPPLCSNCVGDSVSVHDVYRSGKVYRCTLGPAYLPDFPDKINFSVWLVSVCWWIFYTDGLRAPDVGERKEEACFQVLVLRTMKNQLLAAGFLTSSWFISCQAVSCPVGEGKKANRKWSREASCLLNISKWLLTFWWEVCVRVFLNWVKH